jgi:hypothetical protein
VVRRVFGVLGRYLALAAAWALLALGALLIGGAAGGPYGVSVRGLQMRLKHKTARMELELAHKMRLRQLAGEGAAKSALREEQERYTAEAERLVHKQEDELAEEATRLGLRWRMEQGLVGGVLASLAGAALTRGKRRVPLGKGE